MECDETPEGEENSGEEEEEFSELTLVDGIISRKIKRLVGKQIALQHFLNLSFSRLNPGEEVKRIWAISRKVDEESHPDDWKKIGVNSDIRAYTDHPGACSFKAPAVDVEAPELKYRDKKEAEKKVTYFSTKSPTVV